MVNFLTGRQITRSNVGELLNWHQHDDQDELFTPGYKGHR